MLAQKLIKLTGLIKSVGPPSIILVAPLEKQRDASKNHFHPALTSTLVERKSLN
jgi:hypothetical protein